MTVRELIAALGALDPDLEVRRVDSEDMPADIEDVQLDFEVVWDGKDGGRVPKAYVRLS